MMKKPSQNGFTIAELLVASAVFSVVLLVALAGFLQIGHLFYKGVSTTQTQNSAKQIIDDLSSSVQTADNVQLLSSSADGYAYFCIGNSRYTLNMGNEVDLSAAPNNDPGGNFGLLKDKLPGGDPCAAPCPPSADSCLAGTIRFNDPVVDLLGDKTRVAQLQLLPVSGTTNLYTIGLTLAYGDDEVLDLTDPGTPQCRTNISTREFCSVSSLTTSVYKGFGP